MNLKEVQALSDDELRIKVAEYVPRYSNPRIGVFSNTPIGDIDIGEGYPVAEVLPNYPEDLNAMHKAEKLLCGRTRQAMQHLCAMSGHSMLGDGYRWALFEASARQRAEAFVLAMEAI